MTSDQKNNGPLFSSTSKVEEKKVHLSLWSDENLGSYGYFDVFHRCQTSDHKSQKTQKVHISLIWRLIKKIKALCFIQLKKLKKRKCTYFYATMQTWEVMAILLFCIDTEHRIANHKNTKGPYLHYMTSDKKNKGTLFSSTSKFEEKKVHLFSWSKVNLLWEFRLFANIANITFF